MTPPQLRLELYSSVNEVQQSIHLDVSGDLTSVCGYLDGALRFSEFSSGLGDGKNLKLDTGICDPQLAAQSLSWLIAETLRTHGNQPQSPAPHCHPVVLTPSAATPAGGLVSLKRRTTWGSHGSGPSTPTVSTSSAFHTHKLAATSEVATEDQSTEAGNVEARSQLEQAGDTGATDAAGGGAGAASTAAGAEQQQALLSAAAAESEGMAASTTAAVQAAALKEAAAEHAQQCVGAESLEASDTSQSRAGHSQQAAQESIAGQLRVTPANVASLLQLADQWDAPRLRVRVLQELRHSGLFCGGLLKQNTSASALENVPQVLVLLEQAMPFVGDIDGGLKCLQADCLTWLADNAVRAWPTRAFVALPSVLQKRVLQYATGSLRVHGALGALLRCQHLQAAVPSGLSWAECVADLAQQLREVTLHFIWSDFVSVICSPSAKKDLASPWSTEVLAEVSAYAKEQGSPADTIKTLVDWPKVQRKLASWEELPHLQEAVAAFYADLRAHTARHFSGISSSVAWKVLPVSKQQQLQSDLKVLQLTSKPADPKLAGKGSSIKRAALQGWATHNSDDSSAQLREGPHKGGTMFIITDTSPSPPTLVPAPPKPALTAASLAARQRREAAAAAAAAAVLVKAPSKPTAAGNAPSLGSNIVKPTASANAPPSRPAASRPSSAAAAAIATAAPPQPASLHPSRPVSAHSRSDTTSSTRPVSAWQSQNKLTHPCSSGMLNSRTPLAACTGNTESTAGGRRGLSTNSSISSSSSSSIANSHGLSSRHRQTPQTHVGEPCRMIPQSRNSYMGFQQASKAALLGLTGEPHADAGVCSPGTASAHKRSHLTARRTMPSAPPNTVHDCVTCSRHRRPTMHGAAASSKPAAAKPAPSKPAATPVPAMLEPPEAVNSNQPPVIAGGGPVPATKVVAG